MTPYLQDADATLYHGDALEVLRQLPDGSVHMCCTSPPFYGLRDYGTGTWEGGDPDCPHRQPATGGNPLQGANKGNNNAEAAPFRDTCGLCGARRIDRQIGLEETPEQWVDNLVNVFREVRRVLRDDGTLWVEIGDSYISGQGGRQSSVGEMPARPLVFDSVGDVGRDDVDTGSWRSGATSKMTPARGTTDLKPKDLLGQPWLLARALQQPYYSGDIHNERDRVWLSATIDAEGCIAGNSHVRKDDKSVRTAIHVSITNTSKALLDEAARIWPASRQQHDKRDGSMGERPCWRWVANNVDRCSMLMRELYPYLIVKKRQALLAFNFYEMSRISKRYGTTKQGEEMRGRRDWIVAALSELNRGRVIDIPSWITEPPTLNEPGWYLRSEIIWARPNPMPESVTDRPTKAHSTVFLLAKQPRYFYDADAIREAYAPASIERDKYGHNNAYGSQFAAHPTEKRSGKRLEPGQINTLGGLPPEAPRGPDGRRQTNVTKGENSEQHRDGERWPNPAGANARSVWTIPTQPTPFAHFATWPEKLCARMILAGTSERGVCPQCGAPWLRETEATDDYKLRLASAREGTRSPKHLAGKDPLAKASLDQRGHFSADYVTLGWSPSCQHTAQPIPATVLDPFGGSGTTAVVARKHDRRSIGIELNEQYLELAAGRLAQQSLLAGADHA